MKFTCLLLFILFSFKTPSSETPSSETTEQIKVLKVGVYNIEPFFNFEEKDLVGGGTLKLLELIRKELNISFKYEVYPYPRVLSKLNKGEIDLAIFYPSNNKNDNYTALVKTLGNDNLIFSSPKIKAEKLSDLFGHSLAVITGASYSDAIDKSHEIDKHEYTTYNQGISVFKHSRVDAIILPRVTSEYYQKQLKLDKSLFMYSFILNHKANWIHVRKGLDPALRQELIKANNKVINKYDLKSLYDLYK